jgi:hypothetical protein
MSRIKSNKEYALKITHPEYGDFYLSHVQKYRFGNKLDHGYIFTKDLTKVRKWKSEKYILNCIEEIKKYLNNKNADIKLVFGSNVRDELKTKLSFYGKRYFLMIPFITSEEMLKNAKDEFDKTNEKLISSSKEFVKILKKKNFNTEDFSENYRVFNNHKYNHARHYECLENHKKGEEVFFNIANASFGFRLLKLRTLKAYQEDNLCDLSDDINE